MFILFFFQQVKTLNWMFTSEADDGVFSIIKAQHLGKKTNWELFRYEMSDIMRQKGWIRIGFATAGSTDKYIYDIWEKYE